MNKTKTDTIPPFYTTYFYLMRQCFAYVGNMRGRYIAALGLLVLSQCLFRINPIFLGEFINSLQRGGDDILRAAFFWLFLYFIFENLPWAFWKPARQWERQAAFEMRQNFYNRHYYILRHLPIKWHQDHHSGNTINRVRKASETLFDFGQEQYEYLQRAVNIIMTLIILTWYSPILSLLAIICMACVVTLVRGYDRRLSPLYARENDYEHKFFEGFFDYVSSMMTVITLRLGEKSQEDLNRRHARIKPFFRRETRLNENKYLFLTIFVSTATALVLGGYTWISIESGVIQIGTLVVLFQYFNTFTDSCYFLAWQIEKTTRWYNDFKAAEPILLATPQDMKDSKDHLDWSNMTLYDLSFKHDPDGPLILDHITFGFQKNQKIAIIGESGSGKSTLLAMMRGIYEPLTGKLFMDDTPCDDFHPIYDQTTFIPQEPEIFENTIYHNLTLGIEYTPEQVERAVHMAAFDRVISKLPKGYDTDIREKGVNLSGGEKQRLALARGILATGDSEILSMDEPSSALDIQTETTVFDRIFSTYHDKTMIASIHRLHILPRFDMIYVMDKGRIVEFGSFQSLAARPDGMFQKLWQKHLDIINH